MCNPTGSHHFGCDCHEAQWAEKLAAAEARIREMEEAATAREAVVLAHMEARCRAEEWTVRYEKALEDIRATAATEAVREAAALLNLTVRMRESKRACHDQSCRNVALGAENLLSALSAPPAATSMHAPAPDAAKGGE